MDSLARTLSITSVKSWKIVLSFPFKNDKLETIIPYGFRFLCEQVLPKASPHTLDIAIIPKNYGFRLIEGGYHAPSQVLKPLDYIRNVTNVTLRDAEDSEIPEFYAQYSRHRSVEKCMLRKSGYVSQFHDCPELKVDLATPLRELGPVEFVSKMYPQLLKYAQTFERDECFRLEMAIPLGENLCLYEQNYKRYPRVRDYKSIKGTRNPFRGALVHPVELNLTLPYSTLNTHDTDLFKRFRKNVVEALEAQYQRISEAATNIAEYIKDEKTKQGLFDAFFSRKAFFASEYILYDGHWQDWDGDMGATGIRILQEYAASFQRDVPDELLQQFEPEQRRLNALYSTVEPLKSVKKVILAYDAKNFRPLCRLFREAVDELDKRFLGIRKAREGLLAFDTKNCPGVVLEQLDMHLVEPVNWKVNENRHVNSIGPLLPEGVDSSLIQHAWGKDVVVNYH
jgi:hypothetical protein